jgi:hypothetical protein
MKLAHLNQGGCVAAITGLIAARVEVSEIGVTQRD